MKRVTELLTALVFVSLIIFISCKKGDDGPSGPTPEEEQAELFSVSWTLSEASVGATERPEWDGFSITVSGNENGGTINTSGVPDDNGASDVWPVGSTTWEFGETIGSVVRGDGVEMDIQSLTESSLILRFNITGSGSRVAGFDGSWTFEFTTTP